MAKENGLKPTSGLEWRRPRQEGVVVELPSGAVARLRPVALDALLAQGTIPDFLSPQAADALWEDDPTDSTKFLGNADMAMKMAELINVVLPAVFVEPKIVEDPQADDEIRIDDIHFTDKAIAFALAIRPVEVMRRFRVEQGGDVEDLPDGKDVRSPAK